MTHYVCGFAFSPGNKQVLLIEKAKPDWQKGKLNGVGGKVEQGENSHIAMVREFREETGYITKNQDWDKFVRLECTDCTVHFFVCHSHKMLSPRPPSSSMEEPVKWYDIIPLPENVIVNLNWLIPLALDKTIDHPVVMLDTEHGMGI